MSTVTGGLGEPEQGRIPRPGTTPGTGSTSAPHGRAVHVLLFTGALAAWLAIAFGLAFVLASGLTRDFYLSEQARDAAVMRAMIFIYAASAVYQVVTMGLIASRVGYRFRDGLFMLVPIYNWIFPLKMLWRWTALPDRYWAEEDPWSVGDVPAGAASVDAQPPARKKHLVAVLAGGLGLLLLAVPVGYFVSQRGGETSGSDEWQTTSAHGMSIALPPSFTVSTDPDALVQALAEVGDPSLDETAEMIRQFPDFFVLHALESLPAETSASTVLVMRFPTGGLTLEEFAREVVASMEGSEGVTILAEELTTVGTGRRQALRLDHEVGLPGLLEARAVTYLVEDDSQVWMVEFASPLGRYEQLSPVFDRVIASLTLP